MRVAGMGVGVGVGWGVGVGMGSGVIVGGMMTGVGSGWEENTLQPENINEMIKLMDSSLNFDILTL